MPYLMINTQVRLDVGPTYVGDEWSDPELMASLDASLIKQLGNNYAQYKTELPPRLVLDRLELQGFRVVAVTGVGQTCIWTLHSEAGSCDASGVKGSSMAGQGMNGATASDGGQGPGK